jgi:hypothetical protein
MRRPERFIGLIRRDGRPLTQVSLANAVTEPQRFGLQLITVAFAGQRRAADIRRPRCPTMAQPQRRPRAVQVSVGGGGGTSGSTGSVSTLRRSGAGMTHGPRDLLVIYRFGNAGRRLGLTWLSGERAPDREPVPCLIGEFAHTGGEMRADTGTCPSGRGRAGYR